MPRNSLISLAMGPPASSVPRVATLRASVSPKAFKAGETCCRSSSYSIHHCRRGNVLPKLVVQDCDCSEPTSPLCSSREHLATDSSLSPLTSAHHKKVVTMHQDADLQDFLAEVTRRRRASGKAFLLQDMCIVFSPPLL